MLIQATEGILEKQGWQFSVLGDSVLRIDFNGESTTWVTLVKCIESYQQLLIYSICPNKVSVDRFEGVQEFLTRANFGLKFGNFEFDYRDGEVRFKTSVQFAGEVDPAAMIEECLSINVITFERYLGGLLQVMFTDISAEEAIAKIESEES
ncbi:YbjN domain-containing protein [Spirulina subsalsa]|uniref:YbjN domain-containing protein n=1 Tax=Spirulina subsalsa TaxID=54311 RepID=UPI000363468F|nr:YbjN domain-containing protein [Spirulina subsalsa]